MTLLIGIGGTGAKIVESVLVLCAAGLGPPTLQVGFIDQDGPNGNVKRSRELLDAMVAFDAAWGGGAHRLDRGSPSAGGSRFMATRVSRLAPSPDDFWQPHPSDATLSSIFQREQMAEGDRRLLDALISDEDQTRDLHVGFKGRPHVGSPAVAAATLGDKESAPPFWRAITAAVERSRGARDERIMLVGSVFGGTGAAGFPTVARMLQTYLSSGDARADMKVGGVLMLPYYSFPPPGPGQAEDVVKDQDLVLQSQAALKYYARLFDDEVKLFEELYVLGWDPRYTLHYHDPGGDKQASPPLPPELIAAAGVLRFLSPERDIPSRSRNKTFVVSRKDRAALTWGDVPSVREETPGEVYLRLGQTLRFCAYWRYQLAREVREPSGFLKPGRKGHPWFRAQGVGEVDFGHAATAGALESLDRVSAGVLAWAALMQSASEHGRSSDFGLWDMGQMHIPGDPTKPADNACLAPALGERDAEAALGRLVRPAADQPPPDQAFLRGEISQARRPGQHHGLGPLIAATHHAARVRAADAAED